ncbi:hypothetical protein [Streptomyces violascens]
MHAQDEPVRPLFTGKVPTGITVDALCQDQGASGRSDDVDPLRRHHDTQLCNVPEWMPNSSATSGIGLPVSITMRTAPSGQDGI